MRDEHQDDVALDDVALEQDGAAHLRGVLDVATIARLRQRIDERYRTVAALARSRGPFAVAATLGRQGSYVPTASSLRLDAALDDDERAALADAARVTPLHALIVAVLGPTVAYDLDQSWVRRQYALAHYPPFHAAHSWHQDGALRFDAAPAAADDAYPPLLKMVTLWIPLDRCGDDAPGLAIARGRHQQMIAVSRLRRAAPADEAALWYPRMCPGDALLMLGDVLHRTHVTAAMSNDRTSVELRFFSATPPPRRLAGDRFVAW